MNLNTRSIKKSIRRLKNLLQDSCGSTAMMLAVAAPALMSAVGVASDFAIYNLKYSKLQSAADQAALAAASELALASSNDKSIEAAADTFARSYMNDATLNLKVTTSINSKSKSVQVTVTETWTPFFAHFLGANVTPIANSATAGLFGESKICVLALTPNEFGGVAMTRNSHLQAEGCTVYSNSRNSSSVYMGDSSSIKAELVCSVGGVKDNGGLTADKIVTDCPVINDPLASRPAVPVGSCDFVNLRFSTGVHTLEPGVYCGGIVAIGDAQLTASPGDYVIKNGPLLITQNAHLVGDDVGFFFTGTLGLLQLRGSATINLNGRHEGPMAGMLFYDDRTEGGLFRFHNISASKASNLTGTIYMPNSTLLVDPTATVGEKSAYTAIVAKRLVVENGPTLVLNSNYSETTVPVPEGIKSAADIRLIE